MAKFHAAHYNSVAKVLREQFAQEVDSADTITTTARTSVVVQIAVNFCKKFAEDNELFQPLKFMDACSPDTRLYPLSDLWEVEDV